MFFKKGDRISHFMFGIGIVVNVKDEEMIEVLFDHVGKKLLDPKFPKLSHITAEKDAQLKIEHERGYKETFEKPDISTAHVHGYHWMPFFENTNGYTETLLEAYRKSSEVYCWADNGGSGVTAFSLPADEPKGIIISPHPPIGMYMVLRLNKIGTPEEMISAYPHISHGVQHMIKLNKVYPWHSRLEGQIEGDLGDVPLTFFDVHYARDKYFYRTDKYYSFILSGIAYACKVIEPPSFDINNPETIRMMRQNMKIGDIEDPSPINIQTKGMAAILPFSGGDRDDYQFQAPVKDIREIELFGKKAWRIRATVALLLERTESDIDLDIYVTEKTLAGQKVPVAGDDIAGTLWLQGYLWYSTNNLF